MAKNQIEKEQNTKIKSLIPRSNEKYKSLNYVGEMACVPGIISKHTTLLKLEDKAGEDQRHQISIRNLDMGRNYKY